MTTSKIESPSPPPTEDLAERLKSLEARMRDVEANQEWDALEPEIIRLRSAIFRELMSDKAELESERRNLRQELRWWDFVLRPSARDRWRNTVSRKQIDVERDRTLEHRLDELMAKFYADKTRGHAREFIRVAEKIQREVLGGWDMKASAVVGGVLAGMDGTSAIDFVSGFRGGLADRTNEAALSAASLVSGEAAEASADRATALGAALGDIGSGSGTIVGAALIAGIGTDETARTTRQIREAFGGHGASAIIASGAILAGLSAREAIERGRAISAEVDIASTSGRARVIAAALLAGKTPEDVRTFVSEGKRVRPGTREEDAPIVAAGLLSNREPEAALALAARIPLLIHGTWEAATKITVAAILSPQAVEESIAFARHVQHELTGTWESEASIIGAGILAHGFRGRIDARVRRVIAAYVLADFLVEED